MIPSAEKIAKRTARKRGRKRLVNCFHEKGVVLAGIVVLGCGCR